MDDLGQINEMDISYTMGNKTSVPSKEINIGNRMILPRETFKSACYVYKEYQHRVVVTTTDGKEQIVRFDSESEAMRALSKLSL